MNTNIYDLIIFIFQLSIFLLAGSIHEFAHGFVAYILGDDTAKKNKRLTLNPVRHIDIFGSILFPVICILSRFSFVIGWMKPVPVNPDNFTNRSKGNAITSFAGPFSNFLQACFALLLYKIFIILNLPALNAFSNFFKIIEYFLKYYIYLNVLLMIFNLFPVPPLDGGWILRYFLPDKLKEKFDYLYRYNVIILGLIIISGVLNHIFIPVNKFIANIFLNIYSINILFFIIPFSICLLIIFFFLKNNSNKINNKDIHINKMQAGSGSYQDKISSNNLMFSKTGKEIINKLDNGLRLNENELEYLNKLNNLLVNYSSPCKETDFETDGKKCKECGNFIKCFFIKIKQKFGQTNKI